MSKASQYKPLLITFISCCLHVGCAQVPSHVDLRSLLESQKSSNRQGKASPRLEKLLTSARSLEKQGKFELAIQQYEHITKQFPSSGSAYHRLAVCHDRLGDETDSSRLYLRALHFLPHDPEVLCDYGYSRYAHGDLLQAETMLRRAIKIDKSFARGHANLALVLARQGKEREAIASFVRSGLSESAAKENLKKLPSSSTQDANLAQSATPARAKAEGEQVSGDVRASEKIVLGEVGVKTDLSESELLELLTKDAAKSKAQYVSEPLRKSIRR